MSGQGDSSSVGNDQTFVQLEAESEWRFELESDENIAVRVSRLIHLYAELGVVWGLQRRGVDRGGLSYRCARYTI